MRCFPSVSHIHDPNIISITHKQEPERAIAVYGVCAEEECRATGCWPARLAPPRSPRTHD